MSDDVVAETSNPTNEDVSIDNALNVLFEDDNTPSENIESDDVEATDVEDDVEADLTDVENDDASDEAEVEESTDKEIEDDGEGFKLPENMPKELQEKLEALDEDTQKASVDVFKQMHKNYTKKNQDLSKQKFLAESVDEAFKNNNLNVDNVKDKIKIVSNYVAFDKLLNSDPVKAVKLLTDRYKLTPEQLGISPTKSKEDSGSDLDDEYLTETEKLLKQKLEASNQRLEQLEKTFTTKQNQEQLTVVERFRSAENDKGEPLHPHFDEVKNDMMDLADINPNMTIDQLYNKAVRMNDKLYEQELKTREQKILEQAEKKKAERLKKAKAMSKQSLKQSNTKASESLDENAMWDEIASQAGFN